MTSIPEHSFGLWLMLIVAAFGVLLCLLVMRRRRKQSGYCLERDDSECWRYHKETKFLRRKAYGNRVDDKKESKKKETADTGRAIAVLNFDGDVRARQHGAFAKLVDEVEVNKERFTEVVVKVSSPGGMVSPYGHLFSQMERVRKLGLELTVCVDVVAASGGYLMSLPATRILAAPFAVVGSVGVVAFVPNVRNFLTNLRINPRTFTAGKYKRTVSLFDEAKPEELQRFQRQLDNIHEMFQDAVRTYRPQAKLEEVQTGDHWTARESIEQGLGLVDELITSQEYLLQKNRDQDLIEITQKKGRLEEGFGKFVGKLADAVEERLAGQPGGY